MLAPSCSRHRPLFCSYLRLLRSEACLKLAALEGSPLPTSANAREKARPANIDGSWPRRSQADGARIVDRRRKEDELGSSDQVFLGHDAYAARPCRQTAIDGIVAVVTHHDIRVRRHVEWADVVQFPSLLPVQHEVLSPAGQRLDEPRFGSGLFWAGMATGGGLLGRV